MNIFFSWVETTRQYWTCSSFGIRGCMSWNNVAKSLHDFCFWWFCGQNQKRARQWIHCHTSFFFKRIWTALVVANYIPWEDKWSMDVSKALPPLGRHHLLFLHQHRPFSGTDFRLQLLPSYLRENILWSLGEIWGPQTTLWMFLVGPPFWQYPDWVFGNWDGLERSGCWNEVIYPWGPRLAVRKCIGPLGDRGWVYLEIPEISKSRC